MTSGFLAVAHGRQCWGIDLSEKYLKENAVPRIEDALSKVGGSGLTRIEYLERMKSEEVERAVPLQAKAITW